MSLAFEKFKIRKAKLSDSPQIYSIDSKVHLNPWSLKGIEEEIEQPLGVNFVLMNVEWARQIIGYLFMRLGEEGALEIMTLGISREYQKKGLAFYLVEKCLKSKKDLSVVNLEVSHLNRPALNLYKKLGFTVYSTRKGYYKDGSDALCMRLLIAKGKSF